MYKLNIDIILYNHKQIKLKRNENNMKSKLIFVTTFISLALCSCSSGNSIYKLFTIISSYQNSDIKSSTYTKVKDKNLTI